MNKLIITAAQK